jgi:hypothetical protein
VIDYVAMRINAVITGLLILIGSLPTWAAGLCDLSLYQHGVVKEASDNRVTPYWAQEAVGAYETKSFLKTVNMQPVSIEIWDGGFLGEDLLARRDLVPSLSGVQNASEFLKILGEVNEDKKVHGSKSLRLLMSPAPESLNYNFELKSLGFTHKFKVHKLEFPVHTRTTSLFVSRALGFSPEQAGGGSVDELLTYYDWPQFNGWSKSNQGDREAKYYVNAAGNGYLFSFTREGLRDYAKQVGADLIFVSSVLVNGEYDYYSGGGPKIWVSGPGGDDDVGVLLPGENGKTDRSFFTRTSAATQFVSSALALVTGLLGPLTLEQVEELLKVTSIKTSAFPVEKNFGGYGVINHYLLARLAHKISETGGGMTPKKISLALKALKEESDGLFRQAEFKSTGTCEESIETLKTLRRAFFLNPSNSQLRAKLANLYARHNYLQQSRYYSPGRMENVSPDALERHMLMLLTNQEVEKVEDILDDRPETVDFFSNSNYTATFLYVAEPFVSEKIVSLVLRIENIASRTEGGRRGYEAYYKGFARDPKSLIKNPYLANLYFDSIPFGAFTREELQGLWESVSAVLQQIELVKWRAKLSQYGFEPTANPNR